MKSVLLIGCGNIGSQYDFETDQVLTYAKVLSQNSIWKVSIFDTDFDLLELVTKKYKFEAVYDFEKIELSSFQLVCIASPTNTHFKYLKKTLEKKVPFIICEKPISTNLEELDVLTNLYSHSNSKIIVNYLRRFQTGIIDLKSEFTRIMSDDKLKKINFHYKKGILNNGSHGFDLIEFLMNETIDFSNNSITSIDYDFFKDDPTISCIVHQKEFDIEVIGHTNFEESIFDLEFEFTKTKIRLLNSSDSVEIINTSEKNEIIFKKSGILNNYMVQIINQFNKLENKILINDNFIRSVELNKKIIQMLK